MSTAQVFIILFRGVGGATQLQTAPLREALTNAGFEKVATYINSGNAIVKSGLPRETVIAEIAQLAKREFGFTKAIHALTLDEWSELIAKNPFPDAVEIPKFLHAAVLADKPDKANIDALQAAAAQGERLAVVGKVAYLHTPNGFGTSNTPNGFGTSKLAVKFDKGIGVENTARNWNTVLRLKALAQKAAEG